MAPLLDDLNTPLTLSRLRDLRALENSSTAGGNPVGAVERVGFEVSKQPGIAAAAFRDVAAILGITSGDPDAWLKGDDADVAEIDAAIAARLAARASRNWAEADRIRAALQEKGILLEDGVQGTRWRRI